MPMLGGDAREDWDGSTMPDARVIHFWDGELQVGHWFAKNVDGYDGVAWDIYYLYGPDAVWDSVPSPVVDSGQTIYSERQQLQRQISTLLK
ncbi:MAG: hypothetical protein ABIQ77_11830 [Anaerolineales bacterium]